MYLAIKIDFVFLWILFSVVKVREASFSISFGIKNIIDESCGIEGKFGASSCVSKLWILHFVKLVTIEVIAVHSHN